MNRLRLIYLLISASVLLYLFGTGIAEDRKHESLRIIHGPYLQQPSEASMVVTWMTNKPCVSHVEYGREDMTHTVSSSRHGLIDANTEIHTVTITGLQAGKRYPYRVVSREIVRLSGESVAKALLESSGTQPSRLKSESGTTFLEPALGQRFARGGGLIWPRCFTITHRRGITLRLRHVGSHSWRHIHECTQMLQPLACGFQYCGCRCFHLQPDAPGCTWGG